MHDGNVVGQHTLKVRAVYLRKARVVAARRATMRVEDPGWRVRGDSWPASAGARTASGWRAQWKEKQQPLAISPHHCAPVHCAAVACKAAKRDSVWWQLECRCLVVTGRIRLDCERPYIARVLSVFFSPVNNNVYKIRFCRCFFYRQITMSIRSRDCSFEKVSRTIEHRSLS
jgi:hypothetical protein